MKLTFLTVYLVAVCITAGGELVSPNDQYQIESFEALPHEENGKIKNVKTGKILGSTISSGYNPDSFLETVWSPDSRYLAAITRGTRQTANLSIFSFVGDSMEEIRPPDY